ncbi:cupredoxin domain-containing protein [Thalassotalea sp. G2M2-11]|uniref:cupredoxin domain-containing protein n=1 Tax=Thalassotalea sp. G2M2-11 TaxID=2787627 RepID=UPI0019D2DAC5|nr:cupredoxin domain-containing protein [Thalassotalea sp. G2M2-11]
MMIINLFGFLLIALIIWWFWLYKPKQTTVNNHELLIEVQNGVYSPSVIQVPANQPVTLKFLRKDESPCAETLLLPALEISKQLSLNTVTQVTLPSLSPGEYQFHCQMQMYRGVLKVV